MAVKSIEKVDYRKEIAVLRNSGQWVVMLLALALLGVLPLILQWSGGKIWYPFINLTFIIIILVLGLNVITGMAGQVSLGHAAFFMVGAFTTGILVKNLNWSFWATIPVSALLTGVVGLIVGAPSLRLKGFYLAVATLAFFLLAQFILENMSIAGGLNGLTYMPVTKIGNFLINTDTRWYYVILAFLVVFTFFSVNLTRSRLGRAFFAVRDNDATAASLGIPAFTTKLRAFFIGSLFAGVAGSLFAGYMTAVNLNMFDMWDSIWYLGMIVIGGSGSTAGTIMGVVFLRLISQILQMVSMADVIPSISTSLWVAITSGLYGLIIVLFVSFQPYGLIGFWRKIRLKYHGWPFGWPFRDRVRESEVNDADSE